MIGMVLFGHVTLLCKEPILLSLMFAIFFLVKSQGLSTVLFYVVEMAGYCEGS